MCVKQFLTTKVNFYEENIFLVALSTLFLFSLPSVANTSEQTMQTIKSHWSQDEMILSSDNIVKMKNFKESVFIDPSLKFLVFPNKVQNDLFTNIKTSSDYVENFILILNIFFTLILCFFIYFFSSEETRLRK